MKKNKIIKKYAIVDEDGHELVINYHIRRRAERNAERLSKLHGIKLSVTEYEAPERLTVRVVPQRDRK